MPVFIACGYAIVNPIDVGAVLDLVEAVDGDAGMNVTDQRLRKEARDYLRVRNITGSATDNVVQKEVSREKLLEMAAKARTREEIIAEQVAISDI